ncbi:hypothetical protein, partial [Frankia sp. CIT1]|uniref:hypothetical protein n=1 Tax=Frankia sp. CIT1 TaxID=2880974 RepID=UPI001EF63D52
MQYTQFGPAAEISGVIVKAGAGAAVDTVTDNALSSLEDALAKGLAWMVDTTSTWWVKAPSVRVQQPVTPGVDPVSAPPIEVVAAIRGWMWPIVITVALCGLTIQAARMALQHKPQPLLDIARGLLMVGLTTGIGVLVVQQALDAGDAFSDWVLSTDGQQLAPVMKHVLGVDNQHLAATGFVIVYCLIALVVSIVQAILMMFREASIPILTGMLVLAAAGGFLPSTRRWMSKIVGWLVAMVCYKPAAALVYGAAFSYLHSSEAGTDPVTANRDRFMGLTMMILSLVALPVLMRLFSWAAGAGASAGVLAATAGVASRSAGRSG